MHCLLRAVAIAPSLNRFALQAGSLASRREFRERLGSILRRLFVLNRLLVMRSACSPADIPSGTGWEQVSHYPQGSPKVGLCARHSTGYLRCWSPAAPAQTAPQDTLQPSITDAVIDLLLPCLSSACSWFADWSCVREQADVHVTEFHACIVQSNSSVRCWGSVFDRLSLLRLRWAHVKMFPQRFRATARAFVPRRRMDADSGACGSGLRNCR